LYGSTAFTATNTERGNYNTSRATMRKQKRKQFCLRFITPVGFGTCTAVIIGKNDNLRSAAEQFWSIFTKRRQKR
jgi:hypothetical protein